MRQAIVLVGAAVAVMAALLGAATDAGPARAAGQTFHFRFAGEGAEALWTTCPEKLPGPNVVCTETFVFVSEQLVREDGTRFEGTTLFIEQFSFKFDRKGNFVFVADSFGFAEAALSIDQKLTSASAAGTVPMTTCTTDRRGNFTCADGGTVTVGAAWSGQGDLVRINDNFHVVSKSFTFNSHFRGVFRDATASGQVNGSDVGSQIFADMFDVSQGDIFVCHGACK